MTSEVATNPPSMFVEMAHSFTPSDSEGSPLHDQCQQHKDASPSLHPDTNLPLLTVDVVHREKRCVDDGEPTSDYGSDPVRASIISSDNPEEAINQHFLPVFEMVKDLQTRRISHSQSSSSSRKHSQDSLSVSSNCSDDLVVGGSESESDSEAENEDSPVKGQVGRFGSFRHSSESPEEIADLLTSWAGKDFIPAAHAVLDACARDNPVVLSLQSQLRQLSNTITSLCNLLLKKQAGPVPQCCSGSSDLTRSLEIAIQKPSSQLSFVVRVLSPTSNFLGPIIAALSKGFNESLYQEIVTVLQKLAWKIEACVRYESPQSNFECHKAVFDESRKASITRFLSMTPPIEPRLRTGSNTRHSTYDNMVEEELITPKGSPKKSVNRVISLDPHVTERRERHTHFLPNQPPTGEGGIKEEREQRERSESDPEVVYEMDKQEEEDYFRPQNMRRCQTMTLTADELAQLGIKQKRNPDKPIEGTESDFQAFRSYSQSFFRKPQQHLTKVPKNLKYRLNKSIKRKGSFGSLMQVKSISEHPPEGFPQASHSQPLASELHVAPKPHLPLMKTASCESLTSGKFKRSASPQTDQTGMKEPSPTPASKSPRSSHYWLIPSRFKRLSTGEKNMLGTAETVKLPRERTYSKSLFNLFNRRHSQHFLLEDNNSSAERMQVSTPNRELDLHEEVPSPGILPVSESPPVSGVSPPLVPLVVVQPPNTTQESPLLKDNTKDEYMQISVSIVSQYKKVKKTGSLSRDDPNAWFEINVKTNLKEYSSDEPFKVFKQVAHVQELVKKLNGDLPKSAGLDTPGKKTSTKKQRVKLETFLKEVSSSKHLRTHPTVVDFLKPDGTGPQQGGGTEQVQTDWELLATFYCPDKPDNVPNTLHGVAAYDSQNVVMETSSSPHNSLRRSYRRSFSLRRRTLQTTTEILEMQTRIIREDGEDVLIYQMDGQENRVIAGTFDKLVKQLAGEEKPDSYYVTTFLYGLRHFARPIDVASKLIKRFQIQVSPNATEDERSYAAKWREIIQQRILDVLFQWMQRCWPDFERNEQLIVMMKDFLEPLMEHDNMNFQVQASTMLNLIEKTASSRKKPSSPSKDLQNVEETPPTSPLLLVQLSEYHVKWKELMETSSSLLAKQLTLVELKYLQAVDHFELALHIWEKKTPENLHYRRNLDAYIRRFNEVSFWVGTVICAIPDLKERSAMIEKFISVAKHCYAYKNFNTMTALLSGLSYSAVNARRLKRSWMGVREKSLSVFRKLEDMMDPANNLSRYRSVLARVSRKDACIPFFAVYLKDFTFLNDGHARVLNNGLINFSKLRTVVMKIEEFRRFQESRYHYPKDEHVYMMCLNLLCLSESQLYEASLKIEPNDRDTAPARKSSSEGMVD